MPTENHMTAGLPAWATEEEARTAAEAVAGNPAPEAGITEDAAAEQARAMRADHAAAARYYWAAAYAALHRRDYTAMRAHATQAQAADEAASPNGVLLAAIFGGAAKAAEPRAVREGRNLPADLAAQARTLVRAEIIRQDERTRAKRDEARRAERAAARAEDRAIKTAAADSLVAHAPIGSVHQARLPYRLKKATQGVVLVDVGGRAVYVAAEGVADGDTVRITSHKRSRLYGKNIEMTAELAV